MAEKPWGVMDPNSQHQFWSLWTFVIYEGPKSPDFDWVVKNFRKWVKIGFGSMGEMSAERKVMSARIPGGPVQPQLEQAIVFEVRIENVPAHDPEYIAQVRQEFNQRFVGPGYGPLAIGTVETKVLAGDQQDGNPADQFVIMPHIFGFNRG